MKTALQRLRRAASDPWLAQNRLPLLLMGGLFLLALLLTQVLQERLARHLIEKVVASQRMRVGWNVQRFEATLKRTEGSIERFAQLISHTERDLAGVSDSLARLARRDADGVWRSPRASFDPSREAGLWIPPSVELTPERRRFFAWAQRTTTLFGLGALDDLVGNTWVLPLSNGEVVFWPADPAFIYNAKADLDYRDTPWVQQTSPAQDPSGKPSWTEPTYDPAAHAWLISVVAPYTVNGQWAGSVGHDIRVSDLLGTLIDDASKPIALQQVGRGADAPLFVVRPDGQILARRGATPAQGDRLPAWMLPYLRRGLASPGTDAFPSGSDFVIVAPLPALKAEVLYLVQGNWIRRTLQDELFWLQLAEAMVVTVLVGSSVVLASRDAHHRRKSQQLLESRNNDLEQLVRARTLALEVVSERLQKEALQASHIQRELLSSERDLYTQAPDLEVGVLMVPSKEVGGDLYDCIPLAGQRYLLCMGDVAGKGMPAALLMSTCLSLLRSYAEVIDSPAAIVRRLNKRLCHNNEECAFTTLVVASLDARSGELRYCNAGHNPMLIRRHDERVDVLRTVHGPALGILEGHSYGEARLVMDDGDLLLAYTDGAIDMFSQSQMRYGLGRLLTLLETSSHERCSKLVRYMMRDLRQFGQGEYQHDDITLMGVRRRPLQHNSDHRLEPRSMPSQPPPSDNRPDEALQFLVANSIAAMPEAKSRIEGFCDDHLIPRPVRRRLLVIVDELLNNSIRHGCRDLGDAARITLRLKLESDLLHLEVRDNGAPPFNPLEAKSPELEGTIDERSIGGLGIHLVRNISQDLEYRYEQGFNVVHVSLERSVGQARAAG
jgi:sigma-B regulation protein RsbU (phosphoserine phosphatase)